MGTLKGTFDLTPEQHQIAQGVFDDLICRCRRPLPNTAKEWVYSCLATYLRNETLGTRCQEILGHYHWVHVLRK